MSVKFFLCMLISSFVLVASVLDVLSSTSTYQWISTIFFGGILITFAYLKIYNKTYCHCTWSYVFIKIKQSIIFFSLVVFLSTTIKILIFENILLSWFLGFLIALSLLFLYFFLGFNKPIAYWTVKRERIWLLTIYTLISSSWIYLIFILIPKFTNYTIYLSWDRFIDLLKIIIWPIIVIIAIIFF